MTQAPAPLILVVDDDRDIRELLQILLQVDGYRVNVAVDGLDAWQQLQTGERPELIVLDLMMPRMDGEHFLKELMVSRFADVPVSVLSGYDTEQKKTGRLNVACWLAKPVELDELLSVVKQLVPQPIPE